jgi:hypothetical protein
MLTLKLRPTTSLEKKSSLEDGKYLMLWLLLPQIYTHTCPLLRMLARWHKISFDIEIKTPIAFDRNQI